MLALIIEYKYVNYICTINTYRTSVYGLKVMDQKKKMAYIHFLYESFLYTSLSQASDEKKNHITIEKHE